MDLKNRPIPIVANPPTAIEYSHIPFDFEDPRGKENLVGTQTVGIQNGKFGNAQANALMPEFTMVRESMIFMLVEVNKVLENYGLELVSYEGYRPLAVQQLYWDRIYAEAKAKNPHASTDELDKLTARFVSDPRAFDPQDATTWPTHSTGGAIDVFLYFKGTQDHAPLTRDVEEYDEEMYTFYYEKKQRDGEALSEIEQQYLENRRILFWAMTEAGFVNYPREFWHYDVLGTQFSIINAKALDIGFNIPAKAFYGFAGDML